MKKIDFIKYIGLPYKPLGRSFDGVDCYGVVALFYNEEFNVELPDFTDLIYSKDRYNLKKKEDHILFSKDIEWVKDTEPQLYDGLIFNSSKECGLTNHIGLFIGNDKFIHIINTQTSMIGRLDKFWKSKLYGIMRYKYIKDVI